MNDSTQKMLHGGSSLELYKMESVAGIADPLIFPTMLEVELREKGKVIQNK